MGRQYYLALGPRASLQVHGLRLIFDPAALPAYPADRRWTPPTGEEDTDFVAFVRHHMQEYRHLDTHGDETIRDLLAELRDEAEHRRPGYRFRARALCTNLVIHVVRTLQQQDAKERTVATKGRKAAHLALQAREYLVKNLTEETGQTVLDGLRGLRLEKPKTYLLGSGQPVTAIARLTGFSSVALFSRTFKRYVGHSPLAYRQERWEKALETPQVERSGR
jgi:AraC-like DNA-binding protein